MATYKDEELCQDIISYAFSHYKKTGTVNAEGLNKKLTKWYKYNKDEDRLNEIFNDAVESIGESDLEAGEFMDKMYDFGCIRFDR